MLKVYDNMQNKNISNSYNLKIIIMIVLKYYTHTHSKQYAFNNTIITYLYYIRVYHHNTPAKRFTVFVRPNNSFSIEYIYIYI